MLTQITLCTLPYLDLNYNNVIDFNTEEEQRKFFEFNQVSTTEANIKTDGERSCITIGKWTDYIPSTDYLFFDDRLGKRFYYFVTNKVMVNETTTQLYLQLDVWSTYLFNFKLLDSFVDRCHSPRWKDNLPIAYVEDEGLDHGDIMLLREEVIASMNHSIIASASVPIGLIDKGGTGGGGGEDGDCWKDGILSSKGFRFIKGFEGFAPAEYQDSAGYWTIGYGITKHGEPDIYGEFVALSNQGKLTEEICAKKSYDLKNQRYAKKIVNKCIEIGCTEPYQFDALVSFSFNLGNGIILDDSSAITQAIKKDITNEKAIKDAFLLYVNAGGKPEPGLIARRTEEGKMFFNQKYEVRRIVKIPYSLGYVTENNGNGWLPKDCEGGGGGTGLFQLETDYGKFSCPTTGRVTAKYPSYPSGGHHNGTDIANPEGTPIYASRKGVVVKSGWYQGGGMETYGNVIFIDHEDGLQTRYAHNSKLLVQVGDNVKEGQEIAKMGTTGNSTGNHCHYELLKNNKRVDPTKNLSVGMVIK